MEHHKKVFVRHYVIPEWKEPCKQTYATVIVNSPKLGSESLICTDCRKEMNGGLQFFNAH